MNRRIVVRLTFNGCQGTSKLSRVCAVLLFLTVFLLCFPPFNAQVRAAQTQIISTQGSFTDNFSSDASLNTALWTTPSDLLMKVAAVGEGGNQCFSLANNLVPPTLSFGPSGMQMSGTNGLQQFTGIQSTRTFSLPFTFQTTVTGTVANGNPFEIFFVSTDLREWFSLYGNVSPANQPYQGIKLGCEMFYLKTALGTPYTIKVSASTSGLFSVTLSTGAAVLATKSLQVGSGPFYLVLGQGEGWPNTGGVNNVAVWRSVTMSSAQALNNQPSLVTVTTNPNAVAAGGQTTISGAVRNSTGNPIAGTTVTLSASEAGVSAPTTSATTSADGTYSVPFTAPQTSGIVTLQASLPGTNPIVTASTSLSVAGANAAGKIWVAQAQASTDGKTAGTVTLKWSFPSASGCKLALGSAIIGTVPSTTVAGTTLSALQNPVPVACTDTATGWTTYLPNPQGQQPVEYTLSVIGGGITAGVPNSVSVYALPRLTYGGGTSSGPAFESLTNVQAYGTKSIACSIRLGCAIDFGLTGASDLRSGSSSKPCVAGSAECDGLMLAGTAGWGILGSVGGDYDSLEAQYGPFGLSGYKEYVTVQPSVGVVSISACKAAEGSAGTQYFFEISDSAGNDPYSWAPKVPQWCASLESGPLGDAIQKAFFYAQDAEHLEQDLEPLIRNQVLNAEQMVQTGSDGAQILSDLGDLTGAGGLAGISVTAAMQSIAPCRNSAATPCTPTWQATLDSSSSYSITVSVGAVLVSLGANGAGELVVGQSQISIGGVAVPLPTSNGKPQ